MVVSELNLRPDDYALALLTPVSSINHERTRYQRVFD